MSTIRIIRKGAYNLQWVLNHAGYNQQHSIQQKTCLSTVSLINISLRGCFYFSLLYYNRTCTTCFVCTPHVIYVMYNVIRHVYTVCYTYVGAQCYAFLFSV